MSSSQSSSPSSSSQRGTTQRQSAQPSFLSRPSHCRQYRRRPPPTLLLTTLAASLLFTTASAQVGVLIDPSKLPACAAKCSGLVGAQSACTPPTAPETSQAQYQSCFCNFAPLEPFKTTLYDICGGSCTQAEAQQIQTWYIGLCSAGAVVTPNGQQQGAVAAASSTSAGSETTATSDASSASGYDVDDHRPWIKTHYQWLIMVIVLFLAAMAGIFGGLWLKRRHQRKQDLLNRNSTLSVANTADALRSRHPDGSSMGQLPSWSGGSSGNIDRIAPVGGAGAAAAAAGGVNGKGKERVEMMQVREMGVRGDSNSSVPVSNTNKAAPRQPGQKRTSRMLSKLR